MREISLRKKLTGTQSAMCTPSHYFDPDYLFPRWWSNPSFLSLTTQLRMQVNCRLTDSSSARYTQETSARSLRHSPKRLELLFRIFGIIIYVTNRTHYIHSQVRTRPRNASQGKSSFSTRQRYLVNKGSKRERATTGNSPLYIRRFSFSVPHRHSIP